MANQGLEGLIRRDAIGYLARFKLPPDHLDAVSRILAHIPPAERTDFVYDSLPHTLKRRPSIKMLETIAEYVPRAC